MDKLLKMILGLFPSLILAMTPDLRDLIANFVKDMYSRAKKTPNPIDDIVIKLLAGIVGVDLD